MSKSNNNKVKTDDSSITDKMGIESGKDEVYVKRDPSLSEISLGKGLRIYYMFIEECENLTSFEFEYNAGINYLELESSNKDLVRKFLDNVRGGIESIILNKEAAPSAEDFFIMGLFNKSLKNLSSIRYKDNSPEAEKKEQSNWQKKNKDYNYDERLKEDNDEKETNKIKRIIECEKRKNYIDERCPIIKNAMEYINLGSYISELYTKATKVRKKANTSYYPKFSKEEADLLKSKNYLLANLSEEQRSLLLGLETILQEYITNCNKQNHNKKGVDTKSNLNAGYDLINQVLKAVEDLDKLVSCKEARSLNIAKALQNEKFIYMLEFENVKEGKLTLDLRSARAAQEYLPKDAPLEGAGEYFKLRDAMLENYRNNKDIEAGLTEYQKQLLVGQVHHLQKYIDGHDRGWGWKKNRKKPALPETYDFIDSVYEAAKRAACDKTIKNDNNKDYSLPEKGSMSKSNNNKVKADKVWRNDGSTMIIDRESHDGELVVKNDPSLEKIILEDGVEFSYMRIEGCKNLTFFEFGKNAKINHLELENDKEDQVMALLETLKNVRSVILNRGASLESKDITNFFWAGLQNKSLKNLSSIRYKDNSPEAKEKEQLKLQNIKNSQTKLLQFSVDDESYSKTRWELIRARKSYIDEHCPLLERAASCIKFAIDLSELCGENNDNETIIKELSDYQRCVLNLVKSTIKRIVEVYNEEIDEEERTESRFYPLLKKMLEVAEQGAIHETVENGVDPSDSETFSNEIKNPEAKELISPNSIKK